MRVPGAFILARYSTDNQNADTIEVQVAKCSEWCNTQGVPILGVYADYAVSGMKDTRPQYEAMMSALRSGQADTVVIYDQSRMFRLMTAWFEFRRELESMGVRVISVTQPLVGGDLRDPANFMNEGVTALFNQMWALQTRQKVVEKMRHMARNCEHTGGLPPLGYRVENKRLVPDEQEAPIVQRIFSEYAAGRTYAQIIDGLNRDGLRTKRGKPFGKNSLHDLLHNEKYVGVMIYGKALHREDGSRNTHAQSPDMIRMEDSHQPLVSREIFDRVQERMANNKGSGGGAPSQKRDYPLRGKVFCGECGAPLVINTCSSIYDYYKCNERKRTRQCQNKPIRVEKLEHICADLVRQTLGQPAMTDRLTAELQAASANIQTGAATRLAVILDQQRDISRQLDNALQAVLDGLNSPALKSRIRDLEARQSALDLEAKSLRRNVDAASMPVDHIRRILDTILSDPTQGDTALLSIITRVEVSTTHITIYTILDGDPTKIDYTTPGTNITPLTTTPGAPSAPP